MALEPGQTLLHYRVEEQIGEGGMGVVWRATDTTLGLEVAIKILPEAVAADAERLARFEREAKLLATLNHPNIAAIHGLHEHEGQRFIAMELVAGEDLSRRLSRGRPDVNESLDIARQVCLAFEAAHERGVIHRDLKPANIQLTAEGQVKVLDFGLAKAAEPTGTSATDVGASPTVTSLGTVAGVILGTAAYMSPEQARGKPVDTRTDIWSFGCLLYEMLAGRPPFEGETVTDLLGAVLHREVDWAELPAGTPQAIRRMLERCMRRDPKQRLRDIGDARIVIEDALAGDAQKSRDYAAAAREAAAAGSRPRRPGSVAAPLIVTAVMAAAVGAALMSWFKPSSPAGPQGPGSLPLLKQAIVMSMDDPSYSDAYTPAISPDGKHLAFSSDGRLWLRDLTEIDARPLPGTEGGRSPFWSPDGEWIGFARDRNIEKIPRAGGQPMLVTVVPPGMQLGESGQAFWDEQGRIVWGPGTAGIQQVMAQGGDVSTLMPVDEGEVDVHEISGLPGERGWVFVIHKVDEGFNTIDLLTPDGQRRKVISFDGETVYSPAYSPTGHIVFRRSGAATGVWALPFSLDRLEPTGQPFLVAAGARRPSVSADGTMVYVRSVATRRSRMLWVDREGNPLAPIGDPLPFLRPFPNLDPQGKRLLVAGGPENREAWLYDTASGMRRQLTFDSQRIDIANWHPDGRRIFFYENQGLSLFSTTLDGSEPARSIGSGIMPCFTSDGTKLLFARMKPASWDWDIFVRAMDEEHETAEVLVDGTAVQWYPILSPDDRFLLYTSNETGRDEIYVTTFPEPSRRWQVSKNGGSWARWRGDGGEIYYALDDAIMAVTVNPDTALPLGEPRELFRRPVTRWAAQWPDGFDVTADGQRFVIAENVHEEGEKPPAIVIVQNWFAEFE